MPFFDRAGKQLGSIPIAKLPKPGSPEAAIVGMTRGGETLAAILVKGHVTWLKIRDLGFPDRDRSIRHLQGAMGYLMKSGTGALEGGARGDIPLLPWPPPHATWIGDISSNFRLRGTIGVIDEQLRSKLDARGYEAYHYFAVPGGFAITTPPERFLNDGHAGPDRWVTERVGGWRSWADYFRRLIRGEQVQFRVFAIVVTSEDFATQNVIVEQQDVERWNMFGRPSLSRQLAAAQVSTGTRAWLLVYEFQPTRGKRATRLSAVSAPITAYAAHKKALGVK